MKSWSKFLIIPFMSLLIIHILFYSMNIPYSSNSWLSVTAIILQFLSVIIVPFSMLRLAPAHPYIATTCYMSLLWALMYSSHIYLNNYVFFTARFICNLEWCILEYFSDEYLFFLFRPTFSIAFRRAQY